MNYFQELLESYDRLKKRTFKLVYLDEAVSLSPEAVDQANQLINQAIGSPDQKIPVPGLNLQVYFSQDKQEVMMDGEGVGAYPKAITKGGTPAQGVQGQRGQNYSQFVNMLSGGQNQPSTEQAQSETGELPAQQISPDEQAILLRQAEEQRSVADILSAADEKIKRNCKSAKIKSSICDKYMKMNKLGNYLPQVVQGWSQKINSAETVVLNPDTGEFTKTELSYEARLKAAEAYVKLTNAALSLEAEEDSASQQKRCDAAFNTITKITDSQIILHDRKQESEGIVIYLTSNDKALLGDLEKNCPRRPLKTSTIAKAYNGDLGRVRGSLNENSLDFTYLMDSFFNGDEKQKKEITKYVFDYLSNVKTTLGKLAEDFSISLDSPDTTESSFYKEIIQNQAKMFQSGNVKQIIALLAEEAKLAKKVISAYYPNSIGAYNSGEGELKTGDRSDRDFIYSDAQSALKDLNAIKAMDPKADIKINKVSIKQLKKNAKKDAQKKQLDIMLKSAGLDSASDKTELFIISSGFKRYETISKGTTAGTVYSLERSLTMMTGQYVNLLSDGRLAEGHIERIDSVQGLSPQEKQQVDSYAEECLKTVNDLTSYARGKVTTVNSKGQQLETPDWAKPENLFTRLGSEFKKLTSYGQERLTDTFKSLETSFKKKDVSVESKLKETSARISKELLLSKYSKDLTGKDPQKVKTAQSFLLKQAMIIGANVSEINQSAIDSNGDVVTWRHNAPFEHLEQARKDGKLKVEIVEGIVRFGVEGEPDIQVDTSMYLKSEDNRLAMKTTVSLKTMKRFSYKRPQVTKEATEIMKKYLELQQKLLEVFNLK